MGRINVTSTIFAGSSGPNDAVQLNMSLHISSGACTKQKNLKNTVPARTANAKWHQRRVKASGLQPGAQVWWYDQFRGL